jgi:hypothetical protein
VFASLRRRHDGCQERRATPALPRRRRRSSRSSPPTAWRSPGGRRHASRATRTAPRRSPPRWRRRRRSRPRWRRTCCSTGRACPTARGGFREDLAIAEDAELNARILAAGVAIEWAPDVRIEHAYPRTLAALTADAFARSRRRAAVGGRPARRLALAARALAAFAAGAAMVLAPGSPVARRRLVAALPLLALGALAGCAGALIGAPPEPGALAELRFHRFARTHARGGD